MRKILLVEDEKIVAYDIKMILSTMNRIVTKVAASGREAIELVAREVPDLILMDISLSGEYDGIKTAEIINREHKIPLIYLTAYADEKTLERAKRTEPMGYLLKPFNETELKTNVEIALYKKEIAERYREKELWLTATLAKAGMGIIKTKADDEIIYMNDVAEKLCGLPVEEARGKTLSDVLEFTEELLKNPLPLEDLHDKRQRVLEIANKKGSVFPVMFAAQSIEDIDVGLTRIYVLEDLTKKRETEKAIRSTRNLLEQTFHILQDVLIIMNADFTIIDCNPAAEKLFGYERSELLGSPVFILWRQNQVGQKATTAVERVLEKRSFMRRHEMEMIKKNGDRFPAEFTLAPLLDTDESVNGWVFFIADSSERKNYERKLREAKNQAEAANRAKSEFIANMSHELRTPLNSIIGMTDLTLDTDLTDDQRESLEIVRQSSHSFLKLLNTILDFSKIETGKIELEEAAFDIINLVKDTMKVLVVQAVKKNLSFSTTLAPEVPRWIVGDPLRVNQVLINLVGNAIKFTEEGFIRLSVTAEKADETTGRLFFRVEDSGIGIPAGKLDRIFDSFRQMDGSTTRKYGGTGLGLTIAKRLIELMKGEIRVSSVENKGSIFSFALPYRKGAGTNDEKKFKRKKIPVRESLSQLKVLVADDDPLAQKIIHRVLEKRGHTVFCVADGHAAIETLKKVKFDVILMDIEMPVLNGLEATRRIRAMRENPFIANIPIVAMTAHAQREDQERCLRMGMNYYIAKPIELGELITIIESYEKAAPAAAADVGPEVRNDIDYILFNTYKNNLEKSGQNPYTFLQGEYTRLRAGLESALQDEDHERLEREADHFKQFAEKTGAINVRDEAFRIKMAARKKTLEQARGYFPRLAEAVERFLKKAVKTRELLKQE